MAGFVAEAEVVFLSAAVHPVSVMRAALQYADAGPASLALCITGLRKDQVTLSVSHAQDGTSTASVVIDVLRRISL